MIIIDSETENLSSGNLFKKFKNRQIILKMLFDLLNVSVSELFLTYAETINAL